METVTSLMAKEAMEEERRSMQMASCFLMVVGLALCLVLVFLLGMAAGAIAFGVAG